MIISSRRQSARLCAGLIASLLVVACSNSTGDNDIAVPDSTDSTAPAETVASVFESTEPTGDTIPTDTIATDTTATDSAPSETTPGTTDSAETVPTDTEPAHMQLELGEFQPITGVPGVSDESIGFGVIGTGPSNPLGTCMLACYTQGVQAYFDWRNSVGGVHGRSLTVADEVDDEIGSTQVKLLGLIESDDVFGIFAAPLIYAGLPDVAEANVPLYTLAQAGPEAAGFDNVFHPGLFCRDCPRKVQVHQAQLVGATKVATLAFGSSQASKDCAATTRDAFDLWGPDLGIELVYFNDALAFGLANGLGPEVTAMVDAGVDYVTTCMDQNSVVTLEQELERQRVGDTPVLIPQGYGDTEFTAANAELLEGDPLGVFFRPFEADQNGTRIPDMLDWFQRNGVKVNDNSIQGWINADMAVTALLAAGPQFDQGAVIAAMNQITDYTAGGLLPTTDWTKQHAVYTGESMLTDGPHYECIATVFVRNGTFELDADPAKPYYCYDRSTLEWTEPEAMNF